MITITQQLKQYAYLLRLDKPIGILLLLWPTLWALWLAANGQPTAIKLFVFIAGVVLMRSAGCVMNDVADRHVDGHVARTCHRPIVSKQVSVREALVLAGLLALAAFLLVLMCNVFTVKLAFIAAGLACAYPLMKRFTHWPQLGLGMAFSWGVPMAFAAETQSISSAAWFLFVTAMIWPVIYDTMYAMADREDDVRIGVKSTAILFGQSDKIILALLQLMFIAMMAVVGFLFHLNFIYDASLGVAVLLFIYQQWLIKDRDPQQCLAAFKNNHWVGCVIFIGIAMSFFQ